MENYECFFRGVGSPEKILPIENTPYAKGQIQELKSTSKMLQALHDSLKNRQR
jgi:hypothetical protein